jgi:hypothetical protein
MSVCVDESGDDGAASRINCSGRSIASRHLRTRADIDDLIGLDRNGSVLDHAMSFVHRNDGSADDQKIGYRAGRSASLRKRRCTEDD